MYDMLGDTDTCKAASQPVAGELVGCKACMQHQSVV